MSPYYQTQTNSHFYMGGILRILFWRLNLYIRVTECHYLIFCLIFCHLDNFDLQATIFFFLKKKEKSLMSLNTK